MIGVETITDIARNSQSRFGERSLSSGGLSKDVSLSTLTKEQMRCINLRTVGTANALPQDALGVIGSALRTLQLGRFQVATDVGEPVRAPLVGSEPA